MPSRVCLVHYHEIGLKGKNRKRFEQQLVQNLQAALGRLPIAHIGRISGHLLVTFSKEGAAEEALGMIAQVPGVARVSLALRCELDDAQICEAAIRVLGEALPFESFKVHAKRSNTTYHLHTLEINRLVGAALCEAFPTKKVDVHTPDAKLEVLVNQGSAYVYCASLRGVGGLPVGTAGKVISLFSSGFDSPVATWMIGRRGAIMVPVHFSGRPMTSDESEWLCQDIVAALGKAGAIGRLYVVPFGEVQRRIALAVPQALRVICYRRMMYVVAEKIAQIEGAKALATGESLGQVASQTLENIAATQEVVQDLPILRPLIGSDKQEIMARAKELGTYEISSQTAPDCCTLFMPRRPETHAKRDDVHAAWAELDVDAMVAELMDAVEYVDTTTCPAYRPPRVWSARHSELAPANGQ